MNYSGVKSLVFHIYFWRQCEVPYQFIYWKHVVNIDHTRFDPPIRPFEGRITTKKANFFFSKSLLFFTNRPFKGQSWRTNRFQEKFSFLFSRKENYLIFIYFLFSFTDNLTPLINSFTFNNTWLEFDQEFL